MYLASYMEMRYMGHEPSQHLECVYRKLVSQISQIVVPSRRWIVAERSSHDGECVDVAVTQVSLQVVRP